MDKASAYASGKLTKEVSAEVSAEFADKKTFGADEGKKLVEHLAQHLGIKGKAEAE